MAYRALYREWRPKDFSHVVGQKAIIDTLRNQVLAGRIAHAYLFCGSRGTGKTSTAKILARAINCLNPQNGEPCGECANCIRAEKEETLDLIEIDAASNNGVDEIRELRETVKYPPQYGNYKVYIIDEVHMLSSSAFNALLKTLEEPPAHVVFILATTEPQKLPETILSRCQRFDFGRIPIPEITGRLKEAAEGSGADVSNGALMLIARAAEGGMRDALSILDMCLGYSDKVDEELVRSILGTSDTAFLSDFCSAVALSDTGKVLTMIDRLMMEGKDPGVFAKDVCRHVRALMVARTCPDGLTKVLDITEEEAADLVRQSNEITLSRMMKILDLFMALETDMRWSSTPRLALENTAVKCCLRIDEPDQQALTDRITELEQKISRLEEKLNSGSFAQTAASGTGPVRKKDSSGPVPVPEAEPPRQPAPRVSADSKTVWSEMMSRIQKTDITVWSFLSQGTLVSGCGNHYRWQASRVEGEQQYISVLNKADKNAVVCSVLKEITGNDCRFTAEKHNAPPSGDGGDEAYLASIYETFGKEPVDIVDDIK